MKSRKLIIPIVLALAIIVIAPNLIHPAEAHILKTFNMTGTSGMSTHVSVKIGWLNEPPLVGDTNGIVLYIYNGTDDTASPIANTGLDNMKVTIQYGGQIKTLTFNPSDDTPGLYTSAVIPTQLGTYNVIIQGTIGGVTISPTTYPMQEVEAKDKYNFPPMTNSGNMTGMNMTKTPEFGPVTSLVLVIAIVSVVAVTAKTRGFLKL
jgi:predicted secreted protein with PEFG-CTERM motif